MVAARCEIVGIRPASRDTVFDVRFEEYEIRENYCQIQMYMTRRTGFDFITVDWGDGTVVQQTEYLAWHNYAKAGTYTVRIGPEAKWWRLVDCYTVTKERQPLVSRPAIFPKEWSDTLESCQGTWCGWNNPDHGGVQGPVIPWGASMAGAFCAYQFCTDVTGGFPAWTDMMTDATHTAPKFSALFAVNMALTTENGWVFSDYELKGWMREAGFTPGETRAVPPPMPHWLVTGVKG